MTSACTSEAAVAPADFSRVDPRAVALLAERWARRHGVLPIAVESGVLLVATSDPLDLDAEQVVGFATGQRVQWVHASPEDLARQIDHWYTESPSRREESSPPVEVEHLAFGAEAASPA
ncbi:MAG: hypothetical protein ACJ8AD_06595, partial [Gemmatimonadaceae bacterium]